MMILLKLWRPLLGVLIVAAILAFTFIQGHKRGLAKGRAELDAFKVEVAGKVLEANQRADQAAADFEVWKRNQRPKIITVVKEVDRVIAANPEWSNTPLPDSVQQSLDAAAAAILDPGKSSGAVSPVSWLDAGNECGACAGLPGCSGVGCGMPSEAQVSE